MINWEELKHIHVIRKLEEVIGRWFRVEIFFVDAQGMVQNYDPADKTREFKNPVLSPLLNKPEGRDAFFDYLRSLGGSLYESGEERKEFSGLLDFERVFVSRVAVDQSFLGCVVAYCHLNQEVSPSEKEQALQKATQWGVDSEHLSIALDRLTALSEHDRNYFYELVQLVSEEIVTFHMEISKREARISALNSELGERYRYDSMIGKSKPMQEIYALLDKVSNTDSTVLIQGENGTGKELIARALHFNSDRKERSFVTVNCSAFNENLLDSELFGHMKGAFTGAVKDKKGLFEAAHMGTLFLDEIGDMSLTMQVKLLRVLQEGTFTPVGGTEQRKVDVRVLAATNKDLKEMVETGEFREDLYYRINVINVVVPALRDRKEDIPVLIDHFMVRGCKEKNVPLKQLQKRTLERLLDYAWPGNIRELENEIERLIVLSGDETQITPDSLSPRIRDFGGQGKAQGVRVMGKLKDSLEELERTMILEGLKRTGWNKSRLAKELGISRAGLIMKVDKYGLDKRKILGKKPA